MIIYFMQKCVPPLRDPIISFLHTFSPKSARVGGPRLPLREILDPSQIFVCVDSVLCLPSNAAQS